MANILSVVYILNIYKPGGIGFMNVRAPAYQPVPDACDELLEADEEMMIIDD